ncbi:MAG: class I SAM-dependent methyltransferase [Spirochaetales bacterium]|nr:class I SAM-dependent methyltransferase [Spirochaetales bacterium]
MSIKTEEKTRFGNWVSMKFIIIPGIPGLVFLILGVVAWPWFLLAGVFLITAGYFLLARRRFSPGGGNLQEKVLHRLIAEIRWSGEGCVLDIGCGSGALVIRLAEKYPAAGITGIDFWGKGWNYSKGLCEENARVAGVDGRVTFVHGSASSLPLNDGSFDLVVSNMVFHEVKDVKDKSVCLTEALRVLKPGGIFVLQDLFLLKPYFGTPEAQIERMRSLGASEVEMIRTCDEPFVPTFLKLPFMLGTVAILRGRK